MPVVEITADGIVLPVDCCTRKATLVEHELILVH